mgnify:CR=1 FL=1
MPYTQLNNLDFADIKTALKDYMRAQTDFTDYDFEGSAISQILDVLAYNTYYTAFNTNMVVNELFLDSATLRDNVVSLAKQLGYTPKSITAPKASVSMALTFSGTAPAEVALKAGSGFVTNYDGSLYRYVLKEDMKVSVANSVATFRGLTDTLLEASAGHVISNIEPDSYTITVANGTATSVGTGGGDNVRAFENVHMNVAKILLQNIKLPDTDLKFYLRSYNF